MGSSSLLDYLKESLGVGVGETTGDGAFTLELTSCLGICGVAPAMMLNEEMFGNLTPEKVDAILEKRRNEL
jgi:NADH:ubiquinone oxidoreductase 24 kD subunit